MCLGWYGEWTKFGRSSKVREVYFRLRTSSHEMYGHQGRLTGSVERVGVWRRVEIVRKESTNVRGTRKSGRPEVCTVRETDLR